MQLAMAYYSLNRQKAEPQKQQRPGYVSQQSEKGYELVWHLAWRVENRNSEEFPGNVIKVVVNTLMYIPDPTKGYSLYGSDIKTNATVN